MTVIYISDFDMRGSGYMNIAVNLCGQLGRRGIETIALGLGYKGEEHDYPFRIVPAEMPNLVAMVRQLRASQVRADAVVVALDVPLQEKLLQQFDAPADVPYVGLFPLEAGPLCLPWAVSLMRMDVRLVMSRCAQKWMAAEGVNSTFMPVGVDRETWRPPTPEERAQIRQGLGLTSESFVVLTVADNQERKNLSRSLEIFADFVGNDHDHSTLYWMVTRPNSIVGWKLDDYAMRCGIFDRLTMWERGIPHKHLWTLFAAADAFLLTSKAEGLGMPVLEAMACRLPVVGTSCAAIAEHLGDGRGLLIEPEYTFIDPWGNSTRYMAGRSHGCLQLWRLRNMAVEEREAMLDRAQAYAVERTWEQAGDVLVAAIGEAQAKRKVTSPSEVKGGQEEAALQATSAA